MNTRPLSRSGHLTPPARLPRRGRSVPLLLLALALAGCATTAPVPRSAGPVPDGPCDDDRLVTDYLARLPGVRIFRNGGGYEVRVRGSLQEPLFILDGLPLAPAPGGALTGAVNPCDITELRVLSDPADLTFYGPLAAHGVVLITTRRQ